MKDGVDGVLDALGRVQIKHIQSPYNTVLVSFSGVVF
jgi:hypothetical protein